MRLFCFFCFLVFYTAERLSNVLMLLKWWNLVFFSGILLSDRARFYWLFWLFWLLLKYFYDLIDVICTAFIWREFWSFFWHLFLFRSFLLMKFTFLHSLLGFILLRLIFWANIIKIWILEYLFCRYTLLRYEAHHSLH